MGTPNEDPPECSRNMIVIYLSGLVFLPALFLGFPVWGPLPTLAVLRDSEQWTQGPSCSVV